MGRAELDWAAGRVVMLVNVLRGARGVSPSSQAAADDAPFGDTPDKPKRARVKSAR